VRLENLRLDQIEANPHQPRKELRKIAELAASIAEIGVTQPVIVTEIIDDVSYRLVDGHRRYAAAKQAGVTHVPAIVTDTDSEALEVMRLYASNTQRDDFDAVESSHVVQSMLELGVAAQVIEKASGLTEAEVGWAKTVAASKKAAKVVPLQASLEEAAGILEFEDKPDLVKNLTDQVGAGSFAHTLEPGSAE
jgi:ParB family chromosome partitioning protein